MTYSTTIPFTGFDESIHSYQFDYEQEQLIDYFSELTGYDMPECLVDLVWDAEIDWSTYAKEYAENFLTECDLIGDYETLLSPREYNFTTDRIFIDLSEASVFKLLWQCDVEVMDKVAKERFTSYDGFRSHYSSAWRDWGTLGDWDHNQIAALLMAWFKTVKPGIYDNEYEGVNEYEVMADVESNGFIDECMEIGDRFWKIYNYLVKRAQSREPLTMAQWHDNRRSENRSFDDTPLGKGIV